MEIIVFFWKIIVLLSFDPSNGPSRSPGRRSESRVPEGVDEVLPVPVQQLHGPVPRHPRLPPPPASISPHTSTAAAAAAAAASRRSAAGSSGFGPSPLQAVLLSGARAGPGGPEAARTGRRRSWGGGGGVARTGPRRGAGRRGPAVRPS